MPAISPDGQTVALVRASLSINGDIYLLSLNGSTPVGEARQLTRTGRQIFGLAWTADSRELVFSSRSTSGSVFVTQRVRALSTQPAVIDPAAQTHFSYTPVERHGWNR